MGMPILALIFVLISPVLPSPGALAAPPPADTLRVQLTGEPVSLDPSLAEDGISLRILSNTQEGLVGYDGAGDFKPLLAESYQVSKDGLRYEFTLRPGVVWSDGQPLKVADFVFGFRRSLAPATAGKLAEFLFPIRGAREFHAGRSKQLSAVREEKGKLVIELGEPAPHLLGMLALSIAYPQRADRLTGGRWPVGNAIAQLPVVGAYRMVKHEPDQRVLLEANPRYWGGRPPIAKVEMVIVKDDTTAISLFEQGRLDMLTRIPSIDYARLKRDGVVHTDPFHATYFLAFNCRKAPFGDRDWRRAVAASIRRDEIETLVGTGEAAARSWVPRGMEGALPFNATAIRYEDSVAKVKPLAPKQAPVTLGFDSSSRNSSIMEKVQQDLKKYLGLRTRLADADWKTYVKSMKVDPESIYRFGWLAPFNDPITHLLAFTSGNPNNATGCSFPEYDRLVEEISRIKPSPEREKKIQEAQAILVDREALVIPLLHYAQNHAVAARVEGFRVNPFGVLFFREMRLRPTPAPSGAAP